VPHITVATLAKYVPVTVSVNGAAPAEAADELNDVMVGAPTTNEAPADTDPPGLVTVMLGETALAICAAVTGAVSEVALTQVVVNAVVPHFTVEPLTKFVPFTVRVNPASPAAAETGLRLVIVGTPGFIVKGMEADVVRSPLNTVTGTDPALAIVAWAIEAVSRPPFTNTVGITGVPFHWIFAPETNPLPFTVSVNPPPPAVAEAGLRLERVAVGGPALIVKVLGADVVRSPFNTVTGTNPP